MSPAPDKPTLLDQLRRQSVALQAQEGAKRRPVEEALQDLDRRLWRVFRWFDEALHHLEVIKPGVAHVFRLDPILAIESPHYDRGSSPIAGARSPGSSCSSTSRSSTGWRRTARSCSRCPGAALGVEERLRAAHLHYHYQTETDQNRVVRHGVFRVTPEIASSIRFAPDYRRQVVEVTLRNVDRFEAVALEFGAEAIDETVLEDLFRFVMGEASTFLRRAPLVGVGARRPEPRSSPASTIAPVGAVAR